MYVLNTTETIAGVAATATAITCTISGMELVGTTETYKTLFQGQLAIAAGTLYTVPGSTQTFIKSVHLVNTTNAPVAGIALFIGGTALANRVTGLFTIPANGWAVFEEAGWRIYDVNGSVLQTSSAGFQYGYYDAVLDFGFVGDLITVADGVITTGTAALACATSTPFAATDVGKRITIARAGAASAQLTTTILSFTDSGHVTLAANAGTTVASGGSVSFGTDNTNAITSMLTRVNTTNAAFPGVKIFFPKSSTNSYGFPIKCTFNKPVQIEGIGGGHNADTGDYTRIGGTRLAWWGTTSDSGVAFTGFFEFQPTGVQALKHVSMRRCWLDCRNGDQNQALYGLKIWSCHGWEIDDFFIMDALAAGLWTNVATSPTEAKDCTRFLITNTCFRQLDNPPVAVTTAFLMTSAVALTTTPQSLTVAANTLPTAGYLWTETTLGYPVLVNYTGGGGTTTLTGCTVCTEDVINAPTTVNGGNIVQTVPGNGAAMILDGSTTANTCCACLEMLQINHGTTWGPAAIECRNSDSLDFIQIMINGGNITNDGAINRIRKPGVRLNGSVTNSTLASRNNTFRGGSAGVGGVSVMGVNNAGARMSAQSGPHYWDWYQLGNGEAIPIVEGNAYLEWNPNGGMAQHMFTSIADQAIAAATKTLLTGSIVAVPPQGFQIGTVLRWTITGTSAAVGVAANTINVSLGTAATTADASVAAFTTTAGLATVAEFKVVIELTIRTLGAAATAISDCVIHSAVPTTGVAGGLIGQLLNMLTGTMATFNTTTVQQFFHVDITTGAAKTLTIRQVIVEIVNPSNP